MQTQIVHLMQYTKVLLLPLQLIYQVAEVISNCNIPEAIIYSTASCSTEATK